MIIYVAHVSASLTKAYQLQYENNKLPSYKRIYILTNAKDRLIEVKIRSKGMCVCACL
jgi:hypothetical protein